MNRANITYALLFSLTVYSGCSSLTRIQKESWNQITDKKNKTDEIQILTKNGYRYNLYWHSLTIENDTLYAAGYRAPAHYEIPFEGSTALKDISEIRMDQFDLGQTLILIGVIGLAALLLLLMASDSMKSGASGISFN